MGYTAWAIHDGQTLSFVNVSDPSASDVKTLKYYWSITSLYWQGTTLTDGASHLYMSSDPMLAMPSYEVGKMFRVTGWITDSDVANPDKSTPQTILVVVLDGEGAIYYHGAGDSTTVSGGQLASFRFYGSLSTTTTGLPNDYVPFTNLPTISKPIPDGARVTMRFTADPYVLSHLQANQYVQYTYGEEVWDVEHVSVGPDHHNLVYSQTITSASPLLVLNGYPVNGVMTDGFPEDREVDITCHADLITVTLEGDLGIVSSPSYKFVMNTPLTPTWIDQIGDSFYDLLKSALQQLPNPVGNNASAFVDAIRQSGGIGNFLNNLKNGLSGAASQFFKNLPDTLKDKLFAWINVGTNLDLTQYNFSTGDDTIAFLMNYAGLTMDSVKQTLLQGLSDGNLVAGGTVYEFVRNYPSSNSLVSFLSDFQSLAAGSGGLNFEELQNQIERKLEQEIGQASARVVPELVAKFVPGLGQMQSLVRGLKWMIDNQGTMGTVLNDIISGLNQLAQGSAGVAAFQATVVSALNSMVGVFLDFGATQLGLGGLRDNVKNALSFVPARVNAALLSAARNLAVTLGGGTNAGKNNGTMAASDTFLYGSQRLHIWVTKDSVKPEVKIQDITSGNNATVFTLTSDKFVGNQGPKDLANLQGAARKLAVDAKPNPNAPKGAPIPNLRQDQQNVVQAQKKLEWDVRMTALTLYVVPWYSPNYKFLSGRKLAADVNLPVTGTDNSPSGNNPILKDVLNEGAIHGLGYGAVADKTFLSDVLASAMGSPDGHDQRTLIHDLLTTYFKHADVQKARDRLERPIKDEKNWTRYIRNLSPDGTDARGKTEAQYIAEMKDLNKDPNTHGHHIVFKKGTNGGGAKEELRDARDIVLNYDINPYKDKQALAFAPKDGHSGDQAIYMDNQLRAEFSAGASRDRIIVRLAQFATDYIYDRLGP